MLQNQPVKIFLADRYPHFRENIRKSFRKKDIQISGVAIFRQYSSLDHGGRRARTRAGRAVDDRPVDAGIGVHPVRRNGVRLFLWPHAQDRRAGVPAARQRRHRGDPVLLCLSLSGDGRTRTVERRRGPRQQEPEPLFRGGRPFRSRRGMTV